MLLLLNITPSVCYCELEKVEGKYIVLYIHRNTDPWVKENAIRILRLVDVYVQKAINILGISLRNKINVTIVPLLSMGAKLGMGKGWGMARQPFLITDTGIIVGYSPYDIRIHPYPAPEKDIDNMDYLLLYIANGINVYLIWNYISYPYAPGSFGIFEALNCYIYLNGVPQQYRVRTTLLK